MADVVQRLNDAIERIAILESRASPGPWRSENPDDSCCMNIHCVCGPTQREPEDEHDLENVVAVTLLQSGARIGSPHGLWEQNADFIAAMRPDADAAFYTKLMKDARDVIYELQDEISRLESDRNARIRAAEVGPTPPRTWLRRWEWLLIQALACLTSFLLFVLAIWFVREFIPPGK